MSHEKDAKDETKATTKPKGYAPNLGKIVEQLKGIEGALSAAFDDHREHQTKIAEGHKAHAAHILSADQARVHLGAAHGGIVQALQNLSAFETKHATTVKLHAAAEKDQK